MTAAASPVFAQELVEPWGVVVARPTPTADDSRKKMADLLVLYSEAETKSVFKLAEDWDAED
jgi:hypothetical protein